MKDIENKMEYKVNSPAKPWLIGIFSFLIAANVTILNGALASSSESGIRFAIISLVIDGVMLAAIIKQWRVTINIACILFFIGMVLTVIGIVLEGIAFNAINDPTPTQKSSVIVTVAILSVVIAFNGILLVLFGRYKDKLKSDSYIEL